MLRFKPIMLALLCLFFTSMLHADIVLHDMENNKIRFSSLHGKWVLINYWASWCEPCLSEIAEFNQFYQENKDKAVIYAVNYDALSRDEQMDLIKQYKLGYPSLSEDPGKKLKLGDIIGIPMTFVFNPEGQLVKTLTGAQTKHSLTKIITSG